MSRKAKSTKWVDPQDVLKEILGATINHPIQAETIAKNLNVPGEEIWRPVVFAVKKLRKAGELIGSCNKGYFIADKSHHLIDTIAELQRKKAGIEETIRLMEKRRDELIAVETLAASAPVVQTTVAVATQS